MDDIQVDDQTRAGWALDAAASRAETLERLKFQVAFADGALKSLMLANGGALIALFTFLGNLAGKASAPIAFNVTLLWFAFAAFAAGLAATLVSSLGAFMSQGAYYEVSLREAEMLRDKRRVGAVDPDPRAAPHRRGFIWEVSGISAAIAGMVLFVVGAGFALGAVIPN